MTGTYIGRDEAIKTIRAALRAGPLGARPRGAAAPGRGGNRAAVVNAGGRNGGWPGWLYPPNNTEVI
jgi:hypothetical protein